MRRLRVMAAVSMLGAAIAIAAGTATAADAQQDAPPPAGKPVQPPPASDRTDTNRSDSFLPPGPLLPGTTGDDAATSKPASRPADPLETPQTAINFVFKQIQAQDVEGVRDALIDPPPPEQLAPAVKRIASNLSRGASWAVVETKVQGTAAAVLYRSKYVSGNTEVQPALLLNRYDRWKMVLGQLDPKRLTSIERQDIRTVLEWAARRVKELNPPATTRASTEPAAATQESAPAAK